ncbi:testicular acid phosphatase, partial [Caerostris extrusa]
LFRNGFLCSQELYPHDPNNPNRWEEGLGDLTLLGRRQMYNIGKELRQRYNDFITANPREVTLQSATDMKSKRSSLCLLSSLYAPTESWEFLPGLKWQPMPIFYITSKDDKLLSPLRNCPTVSKRMDKLVDLYGNGTVLDMYEQQMKFWSLNSGMLIKDWNDVVSLYKILHAETMSNHNVPSWVKKYWKELVCLNDYAYKINFSDSKLLKVVGEYTNSKLFVLHFINITSARNFCWSSLWHFVNSAVNKVKGEMHHSKIMLYSGKSSHVAGFLGALKNFNNKQPPFSSHVLMELFRDTTSGDHVVRWLFRNDTEYRVFRYPGCEEYCPLEYLHNQTEHWGNSKWGSDCWGSFTFDQLKELLEGIRI